MKINKTLCTGILLSSTLVFAGCGDSDDSNPAFNGQNNGGPVVNGELKYTTYDIFTEVVDDKYKTAWGKLKFRISKNGVQEEITTVVGSSPTAYQQIRSNNNNEFDYYAGNNFFIGVPENFDNEYYKISFVDNDTFKVKIQQNNTAVNSTYDIFTYDLSGVGKLDYNAETGIFTDLYYDYFPDNIAFPQGSSCYVLQETSEESYYTFYSTDQRYTPTLEQWLENKQNLESYEIKDVVKENIGQNNSLPAVRFTDQYGDTYAAVFFNGEVFEADYVEQGVKEKLNLDPETDVVECYMYNDIAAKFMDEQIKANYNKQQ